MRIRVLENDRYELNGESLASGQVWTSSNGNMYRFERASDGRWSASFVSAPPISVSLGTSGDSIAIEMLEDGRFRLGGEQLVSGRIVTAANGNRYRLALSTNLKWVATFVPPAPEAVALGMSGATALVRKFEDGTYELDGQALESGAVRVASNGNRYRFILQTDGEWTADFVPLDPAVVALGSSGDTVQVESRENRVYVLDGELLTSGQVRTVANGNRYRFALGIDGTWTATYVPTPVPVRLGAHGGTITLTRLEDGSHSLGSVIFRSGDTVAGTNDHTYRLTLVEGGWMAEPLPTIFSVSLPGFAGSIAVSRFEDGTYFYDGNEIRSGETVTVNGVTYVLTLAGNRGTAARPGTTPPDPRPPVRPPTDGAGTTFDTLETYVGVRPRLRDEDGTGTREGTVLDVGERMYSIAELFSSGSIGHDKTFVESARDRITELVADLDVLLGLHESGVDLEDDIEDRWDQIVDVLNTLFPGQGRSLLGADTPKDRGGTEIDVEDVIDDIQDVLAALGSLSAFEDALDRGIFSDARIDEDDIDEVFSASSSIERLGFGWTGNTRFGAYSRRERSGLSRSLSFLPGDEGLGVFAYSPLGRARTVDLPSSGQGQYRGGTVAASGQSDQGIYQGVFELNVRFSSREVTGVVSQLVDSFGDPWTYDLADVEAIVVPDARLHSSDGSFQSSTDSRGQISFLSPLSSRRPVSLSGDFDGRFLETGRDSAQAAIGTWELRRGSGVLLTGAFGVEYDSIREPNLPPAQIDDGDEALTSLIAGPDVNGDIEIAARDSDGDRIELSASQLFSDGSIVIAGQPLFSIASEAIEQQIEVLNVFRELGDSSSAVRGSIWDTANEALEDHVFGASGT